MTGEKSKDEINWLWEPFIPYGTVTVIFSDYAIDATRLMLSVAAGMTKGEGIPPAVDGKAMPSEARIPENVFYLAPSDMVSDTCALCFRRSGGEEKRVAYLSGAYPGMELTARDYTSFIIKTDAELLVVDTFEKFRPGDIPLEDGGRMGKFLEGLKNVAAATGAAVVLISDITEPLYGEYFFRWYKNIVTKRTDHALMITARKKSRLLMCLKPAAYGWNGTAEFSLDDKRNLFFIRTPGEQK